MIYNILLAIDTNSKDEESAIILVNDILTKKNISIVSILPRCPFFQYPYGQSCCKCECDSDEALNRIEEKEPKNAAK